jgi:hypothetical protein
MVTPVRVTVAVTGISSETPANLTFFMAFLSLSSEIVGTVQVSDGPLLPDTFHAVILESPYHSNLHNLSNDTVTALTS